MMPEQQTINRPESCDKSIAAIGNHLIAGRIGFLIGAGMSIPSDGISGEDLAFQLLWKAFYPNHRPNENPLPAELEQALRLLTRKFPIEAIAEGTVSALPFQQSELEETLKEAVFAGKQPKGHDGHKHLALLVKKLHIRTIYTTNWDNLLETEIGSVAKTITESNLRKLEDVYIAGNTAVIHLHGTFDDNPLIREVDLMDPERPLLQLFLADLLSKAFVFIGYSLTDFNIRALYAKCRGLLSSRSSKLKKYTYVVSPGENEVERRVGFEVWKSREAIYLPMEAEGFFGALY